MWAQCCRLSTRLSNGMVAHKTLQQCVVIRNQKVNLQVELCRKSTIADACALKSSFAYIYIYVGTPYKHRLRFFELKPGLKYYKKKPTPVAFPNASQ